MTGWRLLRRFSTVYKLENHLFWSKNTLRESMIRLWNTDTSKVELSLISQFFKTRFVLEIHFLQTRVRQPNRKIFWPTFGNLRFSKQIACIGFGSQAFFRHSFFCVFIERVGNFLTTTKTTRQKGGTLARQTLGCGKWTPLIDLNGTVQIWTPAPLVWAQLAVHNGKLAKQMFKQFKNGKRYGAHLKTLLLNGTPDSFDFWMVTWKRNASSSW